MADMIPFPRSTLSRKPRSAQAVANFFMMHNPVPVSPCANGMPGHPPCRPPAELEALLRARADTTAAREGV